MAGAKRGCLAVLAVLLVLALLVAAAGAWFWHRQGAFADAPVTPSAESVVIDRDAARSAMAQAAAELGFGGMHGAN